MSIGPRSSILGLSLYAPLGLFQNKLAVRGKITFVPLAPDQLQIPSDCDPEFWGPALRGINAALGDLVFLPSGVSGFSCEKA